MEKTMGKMKNLLIEEEFDNANLEDLCRESHYWMLVDNVANWVVDNKSTAILDDISHKVRDLYLKGEWVSKRKKGA
jgi:hypothetical protein